MNKNKILIIVAAVIIVGAITGAVYFEGETEDEPDEEPEEQADIIVEEFTVNEESESVTLEMDDESVISGTVTNEGDIEGEVELEVTENGEAVDGPHDWTYTVEPGETREIVEEYERHQTWYPGEFMVELGGETIELEVVE